MENEKNSNVLLNENNIHNASSNTSEKQADVQSSVKNELWCSDVKEERPKK